MGMTLLILITSWVYGVKAEWSEPVKLGPSVNGASANHYPFISADGMRLYYSARAGIANEDVYVCHWDSTLGDWQFRQKLGSQINTSERELSPSESPDCQYLWFTRWNGSMGFDLYYSIWDSVASDWGPAVNPGPQFNSPCHEVAVSISPDGRRMFLVHGIRPASTGCEADVLWISYWNDTAQWWDTLIWMGDVVNIGAQSLSATMSLDTTKIYLASGNIWPGLPKFGIGSDLYYVDNTPLIWGSITALGMPPSSNEREPSVSISADGKYLYFASTRDTIKGFPDLYVSEWQGIVSVGEDAVTPTEFTMSAPYPNPFNANVRFSVSSERYHRIRVAVYNILGYEIDVVYEGIVGNEPMELAWNATGHPSGLYFLRCKGGSSSTLQRALLLR
jgi:hypothetical protein